MDAMIRDLPAHRHGPDEGPGAAPGHAVPGHAGPAAHAPSPDEIGSAALAEAGVPGGAPVFVDMTGRRHRLARRIGLAAGALLVVFLGALGVGAATGAAVPGTPWNAPSTHPRVGGHQPAGARAGKAGPEGERRSEAPSRSPRTAPSGTSPKVPSASSKPASTAAPATPAPSASTAPGAAPTTAATTSRPGNSHASPPAWGHTKKPA
ncbi:hypothetical protein [Actinomadura violacea]|uniref:Translation initiation factor IF-2 n=1 Tax=Actinomadura violacea TaxID=2819934 RepID=A0ABS3S6M7_9ACTN|nr:hypothetical protein [Actinomadura violacea]MBO2464642.1 hypothetical protein [Actinomadura violacea]